nr:MAG TPA: hypothetical protein [Caudoviricetes sp.]
MNIINDMLVDKCFPDNVNARTVVPAYKDKTASGNPITLTDSVENKPLGMKLYGWSKQDGTPSPENPVEIESAGMKWSTGKNLFDERLLDDESNYNKQYQSSGYWILAIPVKNGLVTVSVKNTTNWGGYLCVNSTGIVGDVGGIWMAHGSVSNLKRTATLTSTNGFVYLLMTKGVDTNKRTLEEVGYIQVEYGTEATSYEPYTGGIPKPYGDKITVDVCGRNLWNFGDVDFIQSKVYRNLDIPAGKYFMTADIESSDTDKSYCLVLFWYKEGGTIGLSLKRGTKKENNVILNKDVNAITFYASGSNSESIGDTASFKNIMLNKGDTALPYEPYRTPQSTAIITPNGLPGIPVPAGTAGITYTDANGQAWIADEIDLERGKYVQRVWQAEFDGSKDEAWAVSGTTFYSPSLPTNMKFRDGVTNKYAVRNVQNIQCVNFGRGNTALCVANPSEYDGSLDDKGLSNFKAHLAANPLVVMTYLDTPIERDLTSAELAEYTQLYSYKPTTVVENNSGCWMDVTYKAGTSGKSKNEALRWYFKNVMPLVE